MIQLFSLIAITSILILGYLVASQEGMILFGVREWAEKKSEDGYWWASPIFLCHYCQPSSWSIISFTIAYMSGIYDPASLSTIWLYPLCVCGSSITVGIIWALHEAICLFRDYFIINIEREVSKDDEEEEKEFFNGFLDGRNISNQ